MAQGRARRCCPWRHRGVRLLLGVLSLCGAIFAGTAGAEDGPPAGGGPPPVPVLLGIAEFLTVIDRPFDAENIYRGILSHDPDNGAAQAGLRQAERAQRTSWTFLSHFYDDSHDIQLYAYGGGPTFRTRYGNITLWAGTGEYENDNDPDNDRNPLKDVVADKWLGDIAIDDKAFRKSTLNLILEPHYGHLESFLFLSRVFYDNAPDRFLFDFQFSYVPNPPWEKYTILLARRDSFLQSQRMEFFAPESFFTVVTGLTMYEFGAVVEYPLMPRIDIRPSYSRFAYSDGNTRDILRAGLYYRVFPQGHAPMPVFRVGLNYVYDDMKEFAPYYYAPQEVQSLSLAAEYVMLMKGIKYGIFGSFPIARDKGAGFARHKPARTLFGFTNYHLSDSVELWAKGGGISSPGFDLSFFDFVAGINVRY